MDMTWIACLWLLSAAVPLAQGWRANRQTSLRHTMYWVWSVWLAWLGAAALGDDPLLAEPSRYLALCLTGCAGVAVLGARRPGMVAWNFVVLGLLAVLLLPLGEEMLGVRQGPNGMPTLFLGMVLLVGVINYLPTRFGLAALIGGAAVGCEVADRLGLVAKDIHLLAEVGLAPWLMPLVAWLAWLAGRRRYQPASRFDQVWLEFRDRFGLVWGMRLRDQLNRAAVHAGWHGELRWGGWQADATSDENGTDLPLDLLLALMKRFGPPDAATDPTKDSSPSRLSRK
ncbi:MAG: hypothetical protein ACK4RK_05085 [Gemmataceae bacterium]